LYRRGEKLEKMLNHYESDGHPHEASSWLDIIYSAKSVSWNEESSSISEIGMIQFQELCLHKFIENNKAVEISYRVNNDVITVDKALGIDTKRSLESVLNCFND
jgi:hypothetical protein